MRNYRASVGDVASIAVFHTVVAVGLMVGGSIFKGALTTWAGPAFLLTAVACVAWIIRPQSTTAAYIAGLGCLVHLLRLGGVGVYFAGGGAWTNGALLVIGTHALFGRLEYSLFRRHIIPISKGLVDRKTFVLPDVSGT